MACKNEAIATHGTYGQLIPQGWEGGKARRDNSQVGMFVHKNAATQAKHEPSGTCNNAKYHTDHVGSAQAIPTTNG